MLDHQFLERDARYHATSQSRSATSVVERALPEITSRSRDLPAESLPMCCEPRRVRRVDAECTIDDDVQSVGRLAAGIQEHAGGHREPLDIIGDLADRFGIELTEKGKAANSASRLRRSMALMIMVSNQGSCDLSYDYSRAVEAEQPH